MYRPKQFQHPDAQAVPTYATNKGGFVRGGVQVSQLKKQKDGTNTIETKEYSDTGHVPLDHATYEYQKKLEEAGERTVWKSDENWFLTQNA